MAMRPKGLVFGAGALGAVWAAARWAAAFRVVVEGESMAPSFLPGDRLVAVRPDAVRRGDVVVVRSRGLEMLKRVIGLPGERVEVKRGGVLANGVAVREPYAIGSGAAGSWQLEADQYLVLGDDRGHSTDARHLGPVNRDQIIGVVRARYWPEPRLVRAPGRAATPRFRRSGPAARRRA